VRNGGLAGGILEGGSEVSVAGSTGKQMEKEGKSWDRKGAQSEHPRCRQHCSSIGLSIEENLDKGKKGEMMLEGGEKGR